MNIPKVKGLPGRPTKAEQGFAGLEKKLKPLQADEGPQEEMDEMAQMKPPVAKKPMAAPKAPPKTSGGIKMPAKSVEDLKAVYKNKFGSK